MKVKRYFNKIVFWVLKKLKWKEAEEIVDKIQAAITMFLQLLFVVALAFAVYEGRWTIVFVIAVAMVSLALPLWFAKSRRIHIPISFEFLLTVFIYGSLILGELQGFYTRFWWWDTVLHTGSAIGLGFVGFLIIYSFYQGGPLKLNPSLLALFSFCFALSLGALWEIFEYGIDNFFGLNMQKTGLTDTMWDLMSDAFGAFLVSVSGYIYVRYNRRGIGIFRYYLTSYLNKNLNK
jgi:hypothetical protein